jgi:hypothetical protein
MDLLYLVLVVDHFTLSHAVPAAHLVMLCLL